jgi:signal peptidase I
MTELVIACLVTAVTLLPTAALGMRALRRRIAVVTVQGASMQPALRTGDRVLIRRATAGRLRTGQIVVMEHPRHGGTRRPPSWPPPRHDWLIKRVAAVPGEPTPAVIFAAIGPARERVVPAGQLVVLGDNPAQSLDSRLIGYVPAERVLGIVFRALPAKGCDHRVIQV